MLSVNIINYFKPKKSANKFAIANLTIGIFLIVLGIMIILAGYYLISWSDIAVKYFTLSPQNFTTISQSYDIMPNNGWLNEVQVVDREPFSDSYKINQKIFLRFHITTAEPGQEFVMHIFNEESPANFETSIRSNLDSHGTIIQKTLYRYQNDRVTFYNFDKPTSSCDLNLNYTNGISKNGEQCIYDYNGLIPLKFTVPGKYFADFSMRTPDMIKEYQSPITLISVTDPRNDWLFDSTSQIVQGITRFHFENIGSVGLAWVGIGSGFFLSGIPMIITAKQEVDRIYRTKEFLIDDFQSINDRLVSIIPRLKKTLSDLNDEEKILDELLSKKISPIEIMVQNYEIMSFNLWDSTVGRMRDLEKEETKRLIKLHGFLMDSNNFLLPSDDSIAMTLRRMLSNEVLKENEKKEKMKSFLIDTLENNLHSYETLYNRFCIELKEILWMKIDTWKKLENEKSLSHEPVE
jgi:hypothetical protein